MESVCAIGGMHLHVDYHVIVKDFSYPRMKMLEGKVTRERQWSSMVKDLLDKKERSSEKLKKQYREVFLMKLSASAGNSATYCLSVFRVMDTLSVE